ncbi:hypothetical protein EDF32_0578 [Cellulomonas sp. PhB143]|nr:hypothetical protein EDF32_0578 [Cellulomonas sp. PhB143]
MILGRGSATPFAFMFWLFCYIFMGIAPTIQIRTYDLSPTTAGVSPALDWITALLVGSSLIVFELGGVLAGIRRRRAEPASDRRLHGRPPGRARTFILAGAGLTVWIYYVGSLGIGSFFEARDARQDARAAIFADESLAAVVSSLAWVPLLVAAGGFFLLRQGRPAASRRGYLLLGLISMCAVLVVVNPVSGARFTSGTVLYAALVYGGGMGTRARTRTTFAVLLAGFLLVFPLADAFRRSLSPTVERQGFFTEYAGNSDYDGFWQIANSISYVGHYGPTWGRQLLGVVFFWVPRSIWPGKPVGTGVLLAEYRGYTFQNLSAPIWAEAVVNGGLVAALIVLLGLGYLIRAIDRRVPEALASGSVLAVAAATLPAYSIILLRGSLLAASGILIVMLASLWWLGERKNAPPSVIGLENPGTSDRSTRARSAA